LTTSETRDLVYDWNRDRFPDRAREIEFDDETLRDGLQSPSVKTPELDEKIRVLHLMHDLGIHAADLGLPGAGPRQAKEIERLAREIVDQKLSVEPNVACRTLVVDIEPAVEISQRVGVPIEVSAFIGSSEIRKFVEKWDLEMMLRVSREAIRFARKHDLPVMYVTEDTSRAHPDTIRALYTAAIEEGAGRICICDTTGHSTPSGVQSVIRFVKEEVVDKVAPHVKVDWHGHNDRGLGVVNTIAAVEAGVDRVHGTILGIGERCGNTSLDHVLVNLKLMGVIDQDLRKLDDYCRLVSEITDVPIPRNYPVFGSDAFETATGVHAAAVVKAFRMNDAWLANRVYSGVPADDFGREQVITVGNMSGKSNVIFYLEQRGITPSEDIVDRVLQRAKESKRVLTEEEILEIASSN